MSAVEIEEEWVAAYLWEGFYEVSSLGRVRSLERLAKVRLGWRLFPSSMIKPIFHKRIKYNVVNLTANKIRKQVLVHRLVLESFLGECPHGMEACHNNGNRLDNSLKNLRWDTRKNNHADKKIHGTWQVGEKNPFSKLNNEDVRRIRESKDGIASLIKEFGRSRGCIKNVISRQTWKHIP